MHVRVFPFGRSLQPGDLREVGHELRDEAFEEGHHDHDRNAREPRHELPDGLQISIDGKGVGVRRHCVGGDGEFP